MDTMREKEKLEEMWLSGRAPWKVEVMVDLNFYRGKKGIGYRTYRFQGSWLCRMLIGAGARVTGYFLEPADPTESFSVCGIEQQMESVNGDIRTFIICRGNEYGAAGDCAPSGGTADRAGFYKNPVYTYETNVMGQSIFWNVCGSVAVCVPFLNVTTDKVYHNHEWEWGYRGTDALDGF